MPGYAGAAHGIRECGRLIASGSCPSTSPSARLQPAAPQEQARPSAVPALCEPFIAERRAALLPPEHRGEYPRQPRTTAGWRERVEQLEAEIARLRALAPGAADEAA